MHLNAVPSAACTVSTRPQKNLVLFTVHDRQIPKDHIMVNHLICNYVSRNLSVGVSLDKSTEITNLNLPYIGMVSVR